MNRPLALACLPVITLSGLLGADCPDTANLIITQSADVFDPSATWHRNNGTLVLKPLQDIVDGIDFSFTLVNPARGQSASSGIEMGVTGTNYALSGFNMQANIILTLPAGLDATMNPLFVQNALFVESRIGQTSPFLCDQNVIKLYLRSSVSLFHCKTIITLGGFAGMSSTVPTFLSNETIISPEHVKWISGSGPPKFELDLEPLKSMSDTEFSISFSLTNPSTVPSVANGNIDESTNCPLLTFEATKQSCSAAVEDLHNSTLAMTSEWLNIQNIADTVGQKFDHYPMCLRMLVILGNAVQDEYNPCLQTTRITVTLTPNVPLFPRCTPALTISGFLDTCSQEVEVRSKDAIWGNQLLTSDTWNASLLNDWNQKLHSTWDQGAGTLILLTENFAKVIPGGRVLDLSFFLRRGATVSPGVVALTLTTSGMPLSISLSLSIPSDKTRPLAVESFGIESGTIAQSSAVPCSNASITVDFTLTRPIDTICKPRLNVSGIKGKLTPSGTIPVTGKAPHACSFSLAHTSAHLSLRNRTTTPKEIER
jgi:hypothetical protein